MYGSPEAWLGSSGRLPRGGEWEEWGGSAGAELGRRSLEAACWNRWLWEARTGPMTRGEPPLASEAAVPPSPPLPPLPRLSALLPPEQGSDNPPVCPQCRMECRDVPAETLYDVLHDIEYRKKWDSNVIETFDIARLTVNADVGYYSCEQAQARPPAPGPPRWPPPPISPPRGPPRARLLRGPRAEL